MKTLVLGVGNILNGDDGIGPYVVDGLMRLHQNGELAVGIEGVEDVLIAVDCGTTPENYTGVIRREQPDTVLIVDAAMMELPPGELRLISPENMGVLTLSTHNMPLSLLIGYIAEMTGEIKLIGIQPSQMLLGCPIDKVVEAAGDRLVELIRSGRIDEIEVLS